MDSELGKVANLGSILVIWSNVHQRNMHALTVYNNYDFVFALVISGVRIYLPRRSIGDNVGRSVGWFPLS